MPLPANHVLKARAGWKRRTWRQNATSEVDADNAEGFKQGAKFGEAALSRQAEGALLKTLLC
jgi:hypothetical protein